MRDTTSALVPGVSITVKHVDTGLTRTAISSESGAYNVQLLPVGAYEISTTMPGFKQEVRRGVNLEQIRAHNEQLQAIEGEADKLVLELLRDLYSGKHEPIRVVFLKDLFELLEKVTDRCRDAGNVINHIVLKNA